MYGESGRSRPRCVPRTGLSPRVRGIRYSAGRPDRLVWSIPACTGNPSWGTPRKRRLRVYPRVYGESYVLRHRQLLPYGLSPRVRGILKASSNPGDVVRSIPACTGNPRCPAPQRLSTRVYPRVYGESRVRAVLHPPGLGLSPRVRGIRPTEDRLPATSRSIPACTGNPLDRRTESVLQSVYPRVYGESVAGGVGACFGAGLSPRVRGIRSSSCWPSTAPGSIPACTGNPAPDGLAERSEEVYPRVYGESGRP